MTSSVTPRAAVGCSRCTAPSSSVSCVCRHRRAMLLLDPPAAWSDAAAALDGLRNWPLFSEDALMFYPRVLAFDRLRGRQEVFGSAAAAAGLLARLDRS